MGFAPYVRVASTKEELLQGYVKLVNNEWIDVEFTIPDTNGDLVDEVGIVLESYTPKKPRSLGRIFIDEFRIHGKAEYSIDFSKQSVDFGCVTPFSHNHGAWSIVDDAMYLMTAVSSEAYTGNYFAKNYSVSVNVNPQSGYSHLVAARVQGAMRGYHIGFDGENQVALYINDFGFKKLASSSYEWSHNQAYDFKVTVKDDTITLHINDEKILEHADDTYAYGMYGISTVAAARAYYKDVKLTEI